MSWVETDLGSNSNTSGATLGLSVASILAVGTLVVIGVGDKSVASSGGSLTDSQGNTYTSIVAGVIGSSTHGFGQVFYSILTTALTTLDTFTYTKQTSGAVASMSAMAATGGLSSSDLDSSVTVTGTVSSGASLSVTTGTPSVAGDLLVAFAIASRGSSLSAVTPDPSHGWIFPPLDAVQSGTAGTDISSAGAYQVNAGTSTTVWAVSTSNSGQLVSFVVGFKVSTSTVTTGAGSSAGTGSATAVGSSIAAAVGVAAGGGSSTAVSKSTATATGVSAGAGSPVAVGKSTAASVGTSSGAANVSAAGTGIIPAVGISAGSSSASSAGIDASIGTGTIAGSGTATAVAQSTAVAVGIAAGAATVSGVDSSVAASVGVSAGAASTSGVATELAKATGVASGAGSVAAIGLELASATGVATGAGSAAGVIQSTARSVATATGAAIVSGVLATTAASTGVAAGAGHTSGTDSEIAAAVGIATGGGTTSAAGLSYAAAVAAAVGGGIAIGSGAFTSPWPRLAAMAQSLSPDTLVELITIDATGIGGDVFHFAPYPIDQPSPGDILFGGVVYTAIPMQISGFVSDSQGTLPQPVLQVSNIGGVFSAAIMDHDDFKGAIVTRIRTYKRYLDNGDTPDPTVFMAPDVYLIDQKTAEDNVHVEFKLAAALDQQGIQLPLGMVLKRTCTLIYRLYDGEPFNYTEATCPYTGSACFTEDGVATDDTSQDQCGRLVSDCALRFGAGNPLPTSAFPGVSES
jgi:lambda family phage minor tail protein L